METYWKIDLFQKHTLFLYIYYLVPRLSQLKLVKKHIFCDIRNFEKNYSYKITFLNCQKKVSA